MKKNKKKTLKSSIFLEGKVIKNLRNVGNTAYTYKVSVSRKINT
jgi:hypothetical protein